MGKIKSKTIKRAAKIFIQKDIEFSDSFDRNKRILKMTMPSKKLRNQMAGFLSKIKKQEKQDQIKILNK